MRAALATQADQLSSLEQQLAALQQQRARIEADQGAAQLEAERVRTENNTLRDRVAEMREGNQLIGQLQRTVLAQRAGVRVAGKCSSAPTLSDLAFVLFE